MCQKSLRPSTSVGIPLVSGVLSVASLHSCNLIHVSHDMFLLRAKRHSRLVYAIPHAMRLAAQNQSSVNLRSSLSCAASPSRGWAWGAQDYPTKRLQLERPSSSTASVDVKTYCMETGEDVPTIEGTSVPVGRCIRPCFATLSLLFHHDLWTQHRDKLRSTAV